MTYHRLTRAGRIVAVTLAALLAVLVYRQGYRIGTREAQPVACEPKMDSVVYHGERPPNAPVYIPSGSLTWSDVLKTMKKVP